MNIGQPISSASVFTTFLQSLKKANEDLARQAALAETLANNIFGALPRTTHDTPPSFGESLVGEITAQINELSENIKRLDGELTRLSQI